jgi:hypothetical protein
MIPKILTQLYFAAREDEVGGERSVELVGEFEVLSIDDASHQMLIMSEFLLQFLYVGLES